MNIVAWIALGAISGSIGGLVVPGDEGLGVIGHVALGVVGAIVGGFAAGAVTGVRDPIQGALDIGVLLIAAAVGASVVIAVNLLTRGGEDREDAEPG
jgi:uncharacterized membrane protein YeaQ/YmgE (transglycosylase-associated protein family)